MQLISLLDEVFSLHCNCTPAETIASATMEEESVSIHNYPKFNIRLHDNYYDVYGDGNDVLFENDTVLISYGNCKYEKGITTINLDMIIQEYCPF